MIYTNTMTTKRTEYVSEIDGIMDDMLFEDSTIEAATGMIAIIYGNMLDPNETDGFDDDEMGREMRDCPPVSDPDAMLDFLRPLCIDEEAAVGVRDAIVHHLVVERPASEIKARRIRAEMEMRDIA